MILGEACIKGIDNNGATVGCDFDVEDLGIEHEDWTLDDWLYKWGTWDELRH